MLVTQLCLTLWNRKDCRYTVSIYMHTYVYSNVLTFKYISLQTPLSMKFSRQEYQRGLPFPSPGDLPNPGIEPGSTALQAGYLPTEPPGKPIHTLVFYFKEYFTKYSYTQIVSHMYKYISKFSALKNILLSFIISRSSPIGPSTPVGKIHIYEWLHQGVWQINFFVCFRYSVMSNFLQPHGLQPSRLVCPWDFPGKNTGVDCLSLLQEIFPTQGSNPGLLHCRQILYLLSHQGSPD